MRGWFPGDTPFLVILPVIPIMALLTAATASLGQKDPRSPEVSLKIDTQEMTRNTRKMFQAPALQILHHEATSLKERLPKSPRTVFPNHWE